MVVAVEGPQDTWQVVRDMMGHAELDLSGVPVTSHPLDLVNVLADEASYTGTLVSSDTVNGTYQPVSGATTPFTVKPTTTTKPATFYQSRQ